MSFWTYVNGNIVIDTFTYKETEQSVQTFVDSLPKTSGSERPCEYYVHILNGYNVSGYDDKGNPMDYQTRYTISIVGTLRDTSVEDVKQEIEELLIKIHEKFDIEMCDICIHDIEDTFYINKKVFGDYLIYASDYSPKTKGIIAL